MNRRGAAPSIGSKIINVILLRIVIIRLARVFIRNYEGKDPVYLNSIQLFLSTLA